MSHTFLDVGPIRYDHPYLTNMRSIALCDTGHGSLCFVITNKRYDSRSVAGPMKDWKAGEWHHVAAQWTIAETGECDMALFLDGKKASGKVRAGKYPKFSKMDEMLPIQIGAMNTGVRPAEAAIDELRISTGPRYSGDFTPPKRLEPDEKTSALFHFDGNLDGTCGIDGEAIKAEPGTAG